VFILGALLSGLEKMEEARNRAVDAVIERTKQQGMPGCQKAASWGDVYDSICRKAQEDDRRKEKAWEAPQGPFHKSTSGQRHK